MIVIDTRIEPHEAPMLRLLNPALDRTTGYLGSVSVDRAITVALVDASLIHDRSDPASSLQAAISERSPEFAATFDLVQLTRVGNDVGPKVSARTCSHRPS